MKTLFVPDRFKKNAYRVLGISADATLSEIHKAAATMRRAVSLGQTNTTDATDGDALVLGEALRTEADIRTAVGRLENPAQRISDRLFWLHLLPEPGGARASIDPGISGGLVGSHDKALLDLFGAFKMGLEDTDLALWVRTLRAWSQVVRGDDYWMHSSAIEEQGAFEPAALPSEMEALRDNAVALAAEPLLVTARDALAHDDKSTVRRIFVALEELVDTGPWVTTAQRDITSSAVERVRALCAAIREESHLKIIREPQSGADNKGPCDAELKRFREEIGPALARIIHGENDFELADVA